DIVLEIEQQCFKVHQSRLKCSVIFSDMLEVPQPADAESVDGCPLVQLADAVDDWIMTMKWLYDRRIFQSLPHPIPFQLLQGALRISTKYDIADLRKTTIKQLRARWPSELERMDTNSLPHAAVEAISLARECDVLEILPAAFYALSIQRWGCNADGGQSHQVLTPGDLRRLVIGRERLSSICTRILFDPLLTEDLPIDAPSPFDACAKCRDVLQRYWREKVCSSPSSPFECWLLRELHKLMVEGDARFERTLCARCLAWHKSAVIMRLFHLKTSIPRIFHL
ncbi:hypothetical protein BKA93DRAFT_697979, partial [Sparassis latifolia]